MNGQPMLLDSQNPPTPHPLVVDLDGTLCRSDTLVEAILVLIKNRPWLMFVLPFWVLRGRADFKRRVVALAPPLAVDTLPWRQDLVQWLCEQREAGRSLILCTGADEGIARASADHFGLFNGVLASDGNYNMSGRRKRDALVARYGERGYDYIGNATVDAPVWGGARRAGVAEATPRLTALAGTHALEVEKEFPAAGGSLRHWIKALRAYQWVKNLLLFLPLLLAHRLDWAALAPVLRGFVAFSLCASSVYLLNDLLDLEADRRHPRKRKRPFAAATLALSHGLLAAPLLLTAAAVIAATVGARFCAVLGVYYLTTVAYSFWLKRQAMVDVMTLATLYTLRVVAGAAAADQELSFWILAFSMFLFLSLGVVKRYSEMFQLRASQPSGGKAPGRGYGVEDLPLLGSMGVSAGFAAVVVMALYVNSPESRLLYLHPTRIWLLCPLLLYWISRVWSMTYRGQMHDDPILFALRDRASRIIAVLGALIVLSAMFNH